MSKESYLIIGVVIIALIGIVFVTTKKPESIASTTSAPTLTIQPTSMQKLEITDQKIGTGSAVKKGDTVVIHYLGTLADGTKFDSSYDRKAPFETQIGVGQVIQGWDEGVIGMQVGGKRKLVIPPEMGYGSQGAGNVIPPNATLTFEVELVGIK